MKFRRRSSSTFSHERWLVSYADFVTLLFAFFVVLYASAQVDQRRAFRLSAAIESAFQQMGALPGKPDRDSDRERLLASRAPAKNPQNPAALAAESMQQDDAARRLAQFAAMRSELQNALTEEIRKNQAALYLEPDGLVISLREAGFFDSGSPAMRNEAQAAFARVADILQKHPYALRIEGHTDTVPIHTQQFASNWELSTARSTQLVKLLIERYGLAAGRLSAAGYAEFHPVASNLTSKGRQQNRRVDIVILTVPAPAAPAHGRADTADDEEATGNPHDTSAETPIPLKRQTG